MSDGTVQRGEGLYFAREAYQIMGAAIEVHRVLGWGFLEAVYQEALAIEMTERRIPFTAEGRLPIVYQDHALHHQYQPDFLCFASVIVELKAVNRLGPAERAQILNYLRAAGCHVGLLISFGSSSKLEWQRYVY